jgi:uncharacterized protein Veg
MENIGKKEGMKLEVGRRKSEAGCGVMGEG